MAWTDAARAAAAQARAMHQGDLVKTITSGVRDPNTISALRGVAARTIRTNRANAALKGLPKAVQNRVHNMAASAAVHIKKVEMAGVMKKFAKSYSAGTNAKQFKVFSSGK